MTFDPTSVAVTCVTLPKYHCVQVPCKYIKVCGYSDQKLKPKGQWPQMTSTWPLSPHPLRLHVRLYQRIIVSQKKIHQSVWIQWPLKVNDPFMTFDPTSIEVTCVPLPKDHCVQVPLGYINVCGYSDQFCKSDHILCTYNVLPYQKW